ncbi:MAG: N(4)-(beta-N-acetylglucosaminyl)-L-asparaginase [Planctomycetaceae bacterium]
MSPTPVAISSANGLPAVRHAFELIQSGADALDAVVEGVTLVEDDPMELTVGYGGLPNEAGEVELDAAVMHGPTHRAGGVAGLKRVRHAARLAKLVLEQTDHSLLVGEGALQFARAQGFAEENLLTDRARRIWLYWKQTLSTRHDWMPPPIEQLDPAVIEFFRLQDDHEPAPPGWPTAEATSQSSATSYPRSEADYGSPPRPTGTIHCSAIDARGDVSCVTTTSGLAFKLPGRVGDSAVIGAGLYVDNAVGSCGSTGRGEANLRNVSSHFVVELMRSGASPADAGLEALRRVVAQTREAHLLRPDGRPNFGLKLYVLNRAGEHAGVSLWGPAEYAVCDADGARLTPCTSLFTREAGRC